MNIRSTFLLLAFLFSSCILPSVVYKAEAQVSSAATTVPNITRQLYVGISGADVISLQRFLKDKGYYTYPAITGYYGAATSKAVAAFQLANSIEPMGIVGPQTRAKIKQVSISNPSNPVSAIPAVVAPATTVKPVGQTTHRIGALWSGPVIDTSTPYVSITSPLNNATASGTAVVLAAAASDNVAIAGVQFKVDGVNVGSEDTTAPYSVTWNTSAISLGTRMITAVARDTSSNLAFSSGVSVTVDNGIVYGNFTGYKANSPYSAYASFWYLFTDPTLGLGHTAVENVDYVSQVKVYPNIFPVGTKMTWRVPTPAYGGIYGYLTASYGNYDFSDPTVSITPRQAYTITDLTSTIDYTYAGDATTGILHEFWLTTTAHQNGPLSDKVYEVGMFARTSPATVSYVTGSTQVGSFTDPGGRIWTVAQNLSGTGEPYYMFMPTNHADVTGTVYWDEMIAYLIGQGKITGNEWFNGMAIGPEPFTGAGSVTINDFTVSYAGAARVPWTITNLTVTKENATQAHLAYFVAAGATSHQYRVNGGTATAVPANKIVTAASGDTIEVRGVNATGNGAWSNIVTVPNPQVTLNFITGSYTSSGNVYGSFAAYLTGATSTFARSGSGGYDIAMTQLFSNNTARITSAGLLLESTSTNYVVQSDFASGWGLTGATLTANNANGPIGTNNAATLKEDATASSDHQATRFSMTAPFTAGKRILSGFAKRGVGTRDFRLFAFNSDFSSNLAASADLGSSGGTGGYVGATFSNATFINENINTFRRFGVAFDGPSDTAFSLLASITQANGVTPYNGDNTSTAIIYGAQYEQGASSGWYSSHASSYIPTTAAAATRGADIFTMKLPAGVTSVIVTFDDDSTQTFTGLSAGNWVVPVTSLTRPQIKTIVAI
ncbi:MAG: fibronectin type protein [Parcubacteria group bacterium]|nr:fibronectin type protein [Parcubacteria group bacterium]